MIEIDDHIGDVKALNEALLDLRMQFHFSLAHRAGYPPPPLDELRSWIFQKASDDAVVLLIQGLPLSSIKVPEEHEIESGSVKIHLRKFFGQFGRLWRK